MAGLLTWRARRQLSALAVVALIIGGVGFWFVGRILPEASCTDSRRNRGETEVDCGGPCAPCELKHPKPLSVFWVRFGRASNDAYDLAALMENPNQTLSSDLIKYRFTLLDAYGIIGQKSGTAYIYPGERFAIIEPNVRTTREAQRAEFTVERVAWKSVVPERPTLTVERREYSIPEETGKKRSVIEAQIFNAGVHRYRRMEVNFLAFDDAGNLLGANRVTSEDIRPQERYRVSSIWPQPLPEAVAKIEVTPRVNLFEPDAIIKP